MPLPTLECLDMAGHQVPGLVDVAEELVVVGLWEREEPCLPPAFRTPPRPLLPAFRHGGPLRPPNRLSAAYSLLKTQ